MKDKKKSSAVVPKHSDSLMLKLWLSLVRDFRNNLNDPSFGRRQELALKSGIATFREEPEVSKWRAPVYDFKCMYQLENLFKRYIFEHDKYSPQDLAVDALSNFAEYQEKLAKPSCISNLSFIVMQEARRIIKDVLGPFDHDELCESVQFGKRANRGVPYSESYLDAKICTLSGSEKHQEWFDKYYLPHDPLMVDILEKRLKPYKDCSPFRDTPCSLTATAVPKSFKANRIIMPNTVLGAFYSYGLGRMIEKRLASVGLNIRRLQKIHGRLAKTASKTGHLVTADLSKASDSFTSEMVNRLVPRDWYNALKLGRIKHVFVNDRTIYLTSFMAMGIGYTFTLQTLIFYAVLKSIANLANVKGLISVYGDDCIYPLKLHKYVCVIFPKLGFTLNEGKTFADVPFRESCGSDYFRGVNVRPFQPKLVGTALGKHEYRSFCYKLLNGLVRRWDKAEIPSTILMLTKEILSVDDSIKTVPLDFPDTSGFHCKTPNDFPWYVPVSGYVWNKDLQCTSFVYWRSVSKDRYVRYVYPYLWEKLRSATVADPPSPFERPSDSHSLRWIRPRGKQTHYRGKFSRRRHIELVAAVAQKQSVRELLQEGSCYRNLGA